jgi:tripartite-type tricarboxylate transporter receptor subunit TctC
VPYQQFPQAIADLVNGTNQIMFITTLPVVDLISSGKLRALAVTGPRRLPILPDTLSLSETHARIYWWCSPPNIGTANV